VVADIRAGKNAVFEPRAIPAVVFTNPAIAWAGVTELEAKEKNLDFVITKLPWSASGRAVSLGRTDGVTKLIFDRPSHRLLGIGITGVHAGEMIAEGVLAIEMGATAYDAPHPLRNRRRGGGADTAGSIGHLRIAQSEFRPRGLRRDCRKRWLFPSRWLSFYSVFFALTSRIDI
jgi:hypothetical protein